MQVIVNQFLGLGIESSGFVQVPKYILLEFNRAEMEPCLMHLLMKKIL